MLEAKKSRNFFKNMLYPGRACELLDNVYAAARQITGLYVKIALFVARCQYLSARTLGRSGSLIMHYKAFQA
jgi:hypothetical protein